ncbi:BON domain-containing protein [Paraburkholderia sp. CNPSo 3274]|uniref:BON domain-containing protein n=1 Tax=Paraburkholderia sp. CNPSo 3274 TaxID=2940932 RepID=UPI0020B7C479|nr:BON domain-containing protein [Paraburkholderia sp. CNPSo 3274]MCP3712955.1 BON domain-containing protein [Paraburkholderia sp. CNPSo 3274]
MNTTIRTLSLALCTLLAATSLHVSAQTAASAPGTNSAAASGAEAPATPSNTKLRRAVYTAIAKHKEIHGGSIGVTAKNGAVTLNGSVTDAAQVDKVAEIAKAVPGVTSVTNKLTVQKPLGGM